MCSSWPPHGCLTSHATGKRDEPLALLLTGSGPHRRAVLPAGWPNLFSLPGNWALLGLTALFAWLAPHDSSRGIAWNTVGILLVLAVVGEIIEFLSRRRGSRQARRQPTIDLALARWRLAGSIGRAIVGLPIAVLVGSPIAAGGRRRRILRRRLPRRDLGRASPGPQRRGGEGRLPRPPLGHGRRRRRRRDARSRGRGCTVRVTEPESTATPE